MTVPEPDEGTANVRATNAEGRVNFDTKCLPIEATEIAPDGSEVRALLGLAAGGMAHFRLNAGETSAAVEHRTVDEIWYILSGTGQMWRSQASREDIVDLSAGMCLTLPVGTRFQFRASNSEPLAVIGVTMPPWPGNCEAVIVTGPWRASGVDADADRAT